jgi:hypothetical protein
MMFDTLILILSCFLTTFMPFPRYSIRDRVLLHPIHTIIFSDFMNPFSYPDVGKAPGAKLWLC